jgi:hypothetical protein
MMDMAIRHIGFRDEAESLKGKFILALLHVKLHGAKLIFRQLFVVIVSLKKTQHRADEHEVKLEAAEKAPEEARARAATAEEKLAEEKSKMATAKWIFA